MALTFAGADYLTIATPVTATPFTMSAWLYKFAGGTDPTALSIGQNDNNINFFRLEHRNTGVFFFYARDAGNNVGAVSTGFGNMDEWTHATCVARSASDRSVYRDGSNRGDETTSVTPLSLETFSVGVRFVTTPSHWYNGRIAEVGLWNIDLSDPEIAALADGVSPKLIRPDALVVYLPGIR